MYPDSGGIESHRGEGDRNRRIGCIPVQVEFIPSGQHGAEKDYIGLKLRLEFSSRKNKGIPLGNKASEKNSPKKL